MELICPMTLNWIGGTKIKGDITAGGTCIGRQCAAYREEDNNYKYQGEWKSRKRWLCAMMPQENWHDVEESK